MNGILIVEDNELIIMTLEEFLNEEGFNHTYKAHNGVEALELLKKKRIFHWYYHYGYKDA